MIDTTTSVNRSQLKLLGGEWIAVENSTNASVINLTPEFTLPDQYQGHFCTVQQSENTLSVCDTTLLGRYWEDNIDQRPDSAGTVNLLWHQITERTEGGYYALPRRKKYTLPPLENFAVSASGYLVLKMTRHRNVNADYSFSDNYLGDVHLDFEWQTLSVLPQPDQWSDYLLIAGIIANENGEIEEIVQQQYGEGFLRIPLQAGDAPEPSSSSSDSSGSSSISISSSSSSDIPSDSPSPPGDSSSSESISISSSSLIPSDSSSSIRPPSPGGDSSSSDSDSSSDSQSSSSSNIAGKVINIVMTYEENITFYDDIGTPMNTYTRTEVSGTLVLEAQWPPSGYTITLIGKTQTGGSVGDTISSDVTHLLTIMRNTTFNYWDFYDPRANEWFAYLDYVYQDTSFSTPVYVMIPLTEQPDYPLGEVIVKHIIVGGISQDTPSDERHTHFRMTFSEGE